MTDVRKVLERLDEAKVMKLLTMSSLNQKTIHACTYSSWENDTIIKRASTGLMGFVHLIVRETIASLSNEQVGEEEMAQILFDRLCERCAARGHEPHHPAGTKILAMPPSYRDDYLDDARAVLSRLSLRSGVTKENEEAARLHRKAFNIVSALAVTPIAEWASKAEINSCLDDFRPPLPSPTPPEG